MTQNRNTVVPDPHAFRNEWVAGTALFDERTRRIVEEVCYQGRHAADVGVELHLTRERIRQLATLGMTQLRAYATDHPEGALAHAIHTITELAESAALSPWQYRRMAQQGRSELADQIHRLGGTAKPDARRIAAPCNLLTKPSKRRPRLRKTNSRLLAAIEQAGPGDDAHISAALLKQIPELEAWPALQLRAVVTAHAPEAITDDGSIAWTTPPRRPRKLTNPTAEYARQALEHAGKPLHKNELLAAVEHLTTTAGNKPPSPRMLDHALASETDFRWTGKGIYGLSTWNVGHSEDSHPSKGQWSPVHRELKLLMSDGQDKAIHDVIAHLQSRFTISPSTIYQSIRAEPDLHLDGGVVKHGAKTSPRLTRSNTKTARKRDSHYTQVVDPDILRAARENRGLTVIQAAVRAGLSPSSVKTYEAGTAMPRSESLLALAHELGVPAEAMLIHPPEPRRYAHLLHIHRNTRLR